MEDLSQQVASLKDLLISNQNVVEEHFSKANVDHSAVFQSAEINTIDPGAGLTSSKDRNGHVSSRDNGKNSLLLEEEKNATVQRVQRDYAMSLDVSEYELQMLEMQARQEEKEEQSIIAFEVYFIIFFPSDIFLKIISHLVFVNLKRQLSFLFLLNEGEISSGRLR